MVVIIAVVINIAVVRMMRATLVVILVAVITASLDVKDLGIHMVGILAVVQIRTINMVKTMAALEIGSQVNEILAPN